MRFATTASVAVLALSTAALAQVSSNRPGQTGQNMMMNNTMGPGNSTTPMPPSAMNDTMDPAANMMSNSTTPPPGEPR